ncbi:AAA domain-containing protein [Paenibacillus tianmuensis]|uniref:AAA domain-containing protein n=1 Tax=Paenibacillus tianmuensis TaxID=624147 RepID=A0A1G4TKJ5_9BACL|nr:ATP-binding protein [Paenibacillus tianmuensis]SCW81938.1 AAA domain-containing protein [Paenibacillus tianmuensis]
MVKEKSGAPQFPEELLSSTNDEKEKFFENYHIAHPHLSKAIREVLDVINNSGKRSLIMVVGPSGVGKSTLFKAVVSNVIRNYVAQNKGQIPIVGVEALAPDSSNFDIKDFYIRSLQALREPLIDYKIYYEDDQEINIGKKDVNRELRRSLENALIYRSPKAFLIDEAQHFTKVSSGTRLFNQMDLVKSMASLSKVLHVMIGTYELVPFLNQSGQLSRRGIDVHLPRYKVENKKDMEAFANAVYSFQRIMPLEKEPDLMSNIDFLYSRTIGCVGILKDWLFLAFKDTLLSKKKHLSMDCLKKHAHSIDQCMTMLLEAREYEEYDVETNAKVNEYQMLLYQGIMPEKRDDKNNGRGKGNNKPGVRKPERDKVGTN